MNVSPRTGKLEVKGHFTIYQKSFENSVSFYFPPKSFFSPSYTTVMHLL